MRKHAITVLIAAALLAGCAQDPTVSPSPSPTSPTTSSQAQELLALYFVSETAQGPRLYREFQKVTITTSRMEAALNAVLSGNAPIDPDYSTLWPVDAVVEQVSLEGSTATIDLSFSALNVGAEYEQRAIDQLVWTATAAEPSVTRIRLLRSGKQVETFAGHVDTTRTFARQPHYEVLAPIWITSVEHGGQINGEFTFGGLATVFEANLLWEVRKDGRVIKKGFTTAAEAGPARAPWEVELTGLPSGVYTLRAYANSMEDGSLFAQDTKEITYTAP